MKRNFMFVATIAAGMAMTACSGAAEEVDAAAEEGQEQVDDNAQAEEEPSMMDGMMDQVESATSTAIEEGKKEVTKKVTEEVTKVVKEEAPKAVEEVKKSTGIR